jgi:uncharacterized membrane protein YfhO
MKTPEEIENKLSDIWLSKVPKDCGFSHNAFEYFGKIIYTQCQQDNEDKLNEAVNLLNKIIENTELFFGYDVANKNSNIRNAKTFIQSLNRKTPLSWWNDLSEQEQIQIQKDNGIYGHDEGVTVSEIETFYNDYLQSINK